MNKIFINTNAVLRYTGISFYKVSLIISPLMDNQWIYGDLST